MKDLFYRLIIYINTANEKDTYYNVAWYMANHFDRIATMRINELADACFVSPATISRFCRALGYENFAHLKQECLSFTQTKKFNNLIHIPIKTMKDDPALATRLYVDELTTVLGRLPQVLDWDVIDQVLHLIHKTKNVAFFGTQFSNSAAIHFQTDLLMLEKFTTAFMIGERQQEMAMRMKKNDLAIIVSVNGNYVVFNRRILQYLKKSECTKVLITCMNEDVLNIPVDYTISIGTPQDDKSGKHSLLALMELMSLRYYALFYPSLEDLEEKIVKEV